jgi:hypothetical protein
LPGSALPRVHQLAEVETVNQFAMSVEEREVLFCTNLVIAGIDYQRAAAVAKLLAANKLGDESLTEEEDQIVESVCKAWLEYRQRQLRLDQELRSLKY